MSNVVLEETAHLAKAFVNLIYPLRCQVCGKKSNLSLDKCLCANCWRLIRRNTPPFCQRCGRPFVPASICGECQGRRFYFTRAYSACVYEGALKKAIHLLKYKRKLCLVKPLAELLSQFAEKYLDVKEIDLIVPVPLHPVKLREREFNQAELLARSLARKVKIRLCANALARKKPTISQSELPRERRLLNVQGAFYMRNKESIDQNRILVVDDVFTTGATLDECAKVLIASGAKSVSALTLARGI